MPKDYKVVIVCVVDGDWNLLMIRRVDEEGDSSSKKWEFPAGHIDPGEIPALSAMREVKEETGLDIYLLPDHIDIQTKAGLAAQYLGFLVELEVKPEPTLADDEHDKFIWIRPKQLKSIKPTHKDMHENFMKLLHKVNHAHNSPRENKTVKSSRRIATESVPTRVVRQMPGPGADLKEAILVGDEVEIFLRQNATIKNSPEPAISGIVEQRNRNSIWIREPDGDKEKPSRGVSWKDSGDWAFVRVYRGRDKVIHYINGNPYSDDKDKKVMDSAEGLGIILGGEPPVSYESMWSLMRNETPDLDRSLGQAPQDFSTIAPFNDPRKGTPPILRQVRETLRNYGLEPDVVDHLGNGRVLILTQDSDLKKEIAKVLKKSGKEIKSGRRPDSLIVSNSRPGQRVALGGTTTIPIATDEDLMDETVKQRRRKLEREGAASIPIQTSPNQVQNDKQGLSPQLSLTLPSPQQQITDITHRVGPMKVQQLPGNQGTQMTVKDPQQLQKLEKAIQTGPSSMTPTSSRSPRWIKRAKQIVRNLQASLYEGDYNSAGEFLSELRGIGVSDKSIVTSRIATRDQWKSLEIYLDSLGEIKGSRLARVAASAATAH